MVIKSSSAAERTTPKRSVALAVSTAVRRTSLRTSRRLSKLMVDLQQGDLPPELCSWLHLPLVLEGGLSGPQHLPDLTCVLRDPANANVPLFTRMQAESTAAMHVFRFASP